MAQLRLPGTTAGEVTLPVHSIVAPLVERIPGSQSVQGVQPEPIVLGTSAQTVEIPGALN